MKRTREKNLSEEIRRLEQKFKRKRIKPGRELENPPIPDCEEIKYHDLTISDVETYYSRKYHDLIIIDVKTYMVKKYHDLTVSSETI